MPKYNMLYVQISIHALRVEGDPVTLPVSPCVPIFLSTPSGWRATLTLKSQGLKRI